MRNLGQRVKIGILTIAAALFPIMMAVLIFWHAHLDKDTRFLILRFLSIDFLFLICASIWLIMKKSGLTRAFAKWSGVESEVNESSSPVRITESYVLAAALLPFFGATIDKIIQYSAPDFTPPTNSRFWAYFLTYLTLCFLDARQIKRSGRGRDIALFRWIWLVPVYLWQRSRVSRSRPVFLMVWIAAWKLSLIIFPGEMVNGVYVAGGIPGCNSSTSKGEIEKIFNHLLAEKKLNATVVATRGLVEIASTDRGRTCRAEIDISDNRAVKTTFTIAKEDKKIEYKLLLGQQSGT